MCAKVTKRRHIGTVVEIVGALFRDLESNPIV